MVITVTESGVSWNKTCLNLRSSLMGNDHALFLQGGMLLTYCSIYHLHPENNTLVLVRQMPHPYFHISLSPHLLIFWSVWQHLPSICSIFSLGREDLNIPLFRGFIGTSGSWQWCMGKFYTATGYVFKDFHSKSSETILFPHLWFFSFWFVCWNVIIVGGCYGCYATLLIMTVESYLGKKYTFHVFNIII